MQDLVGRTALVSGSTTELGYGILKSLAARGAQVVVHGILPMPDGQALAGALTSTYGVRADYLPVDLTDAAATEQMAQEILVRFGKCDILINNAVVRHFKSVEDMTAAEWSSALAVNLSSAFHFARAFVPGMKAGNWGRIINMSSIYGFRGAENRLDYVTTKTALLGLTRGLAIELAKTGITCNAVAPGTVPTEAIQSRIVNLARERGQAQSEAEAEYLVGRNPSGRFVSTENVAAMIGFLCSEAAKDINGATLPIDGGWTAL